MSIAALSNRYARALADVIFARGETQTVFDELTAFRKSVDDCADLREVIVNPTIPQAKKEALLAALTTRMKLGQITVNFLNLLLRNQRLAYLDQILAALASEIDNRNGVVAAAVTTSKAVGDAERDALRTRLENATGKKVRLTFDTDPELIGGVVTRIGSRIYDGSIRSQLDRFRGQLSQG